MSRPLWFVKMVRQAFPARFLLAKATNLPVLGRVAERWFFAGDELIYLPADRSVQINQSIDPPLETVLPSQVVAHFIQGASAHWIMDRCICRQASGCKDYPVELGCLFLGEAALGINPRLGRRVTREEALNHAARCRAAGLVHLVGRNRLDTVWLGVGPGERLLTICNCCPCCCLWRVLPHMTPHIGAKVQRMPGVSVAVDEHCIGCGTCADGACFVDAIQMVDGRAVIGDGCRGCGRCASLCPQGAIQIVVNPGGVGSSIHQIAPLVDLS
jgi:ferredoxin